VSAAFDEFQVGVCTLITGWFWGGIMQSDPAMLCRTAVPKISSRFRDPDSGAAINPDIGNYCVLCRYRQMDIVHTVLTDAFATTLIPHPFYDEHSAEGVRFFELELIGL